MKSVSIRVRFFVYMQRFVLVLSGVFYKFSRNDNFSNFVWTVGVAEVAGMVLNLGRSLPESKTVNFQDHPFRYGNYDLTNPYSRKWQRLLFDLFRRPSLFAKLTHLSEGFIYVGAQGFLWEQLDQRKFEFRYLKRLKKKIVCILVGADIRSIRLMLNTFDSQGIESIAGVYAKMNPESVSLEYDKIIQLRCTVINEFSDLVYSAPRDQMSYLNDQNFVPMFLPSSLFEGDYSKFENFEFPIIIHAPSNPIIKGTSHVRAAIEKLSKSNYRFEYREIINQTNDQVISNLKEAHIVINELYAFVPGILGIEAMACRAVLLTRANSLLEPTLPAGTENAWISVDTTNIYEVLKNLLERKDDLRSLAEAGFEWAMKNCSIPTAGNKFLSELRSIS